MQRTRLQCSAVQAVSSEKLEEANDWGELETS